MTLTRPDAIVLELLSDTTFGRGEPTAGEVDVEVEHDGLGLPFVGGKSLHGLLRDAWLSIAHHFPELDAAARRVLSPTGDQQETGVLRMGDAVVDAATRAWVAAATARQPHPVSPAEVLRALTDVRRQTARRHDTGAPAEATLRASRVVLRGLRLSSPLTWLDGEPGEAEVRCLALCALGVRHAGLGRNRGRGHLRVSLDADLERTRRLALEDTA